MITFGITGSIATGKSTVTKMIREQYNIPVVDADVIARQVVEPSTPGLIYLVNAFDSSILNSDGSLNRQLLGNLVFSDQKLLNKLNRIMGPLIVEESYKQIELLHSQGHYLVGYDSALLIEFGLQNLYKPLIVVSCDEDLQIKRLMERNNFDYKKALLTISKQLSSPEKAKHADFIINNDNGLAELASQVYSVVFQLKQL
jgi:dephospho-CoA kinase